MAGLNTNASAVTLDLYGNSNWFVAYANQDAMNEKGSYNDVDVMGSVEVMIKATHQLAQDFKFGAFILMNGGTVLYNPKTKASVKHSYVFAETPYGKLMLGLHDNVGRQTYYGASEVSIFGVNASDICALILKRPRHLLSDARVNPMSRRNIASYLTPRLNGFQFGISYMPGSTKDTDDNTMEKDPSFKEAIVSAATYRKDFSSNHWLGVYVGTHQMQRAGGDRYEYGAGVKWNYNGWIVGAGGKIRHSEGEKKDPHVWNASIGFDTGKNAVSLAFMHQKDESPVLSGGFDAKLWMLSARHYYAKGIDFFANISIAKEKGDFDGKAETANTEIGVIGLSLSF